MLKSAGGKVMWAGRATVFLVGLGVILALLFGVVSTALSFKVQANEPPMKVNSATRVTDLNADQIDGKDSNAFVTSVWAQVRADGTLLAGKGAAAVQKGGGGYFVKFDRDITNCA